MKAEERDQLIDALLEGDISEADFLRLEAELQVNPEARQAYYDRQTLSTLLQVETEGLADTLLPMPAPPRSRRRWLGIAGIAALLALSASGILLGWFAGKDAPETVSAEPGATGFAVMAGQAETIWDGVALSRGDLVPEGELLLQSGTAQIELFSGVTVIVEGAARFEVVSPMEMIVTRGKIRAHVPEPAKGFRLRTTAGEIVDLGTEFAVDVTPEHADVHVLDGEVEFHPKTAPMRLLGKGNALRWTENGETALPFGGAGFVGLAGLEEKLAEVRRDKRAEWQAHSLRLKEDPRLLAYYPMRDLRGGARHLSDASPASRDGTVVRARRVADRWEHPGAALNFSPASSRVRVNIPGVHRSLALYCWVRIDSLDRWYNSLFLTDGHELNEPHWQIMNDGRLFFSVKAHNRKGRNDPDKQVVYSPPFWNPSMSGKWFQIATVFDADAATVTHYINGKPVHREKIRDEMLVDHVRIGAASIGNWSEPKRSDPHFAIRNLNGAIDEFAVFSAALSAEEIAEFYRIGKP